MCEFIDKETTPVKGFVASEDIVCYKILQKSSKSEGAFESVVFPQIWNVGLFYLTKLTSKWNVDVYEHKYYSKCFKTWKSYYICKNELYSLKDPNYCLTNLVGTERGFYSYTRYMNERMLENIERFSEWHGCKSMIVIGRFRIPKGSRYYVNVTADVYISERIKFDGVVNVEL